MPRPCPRCSGHRTVSLFQYGEWTPERTPCPTCAGTGHDPHPRPALTLLAPADPLDFRPLDTEALDGRDWRPYARRYPDGLLAYAA